MKQSISILTLLFGLAIAPKAVFAHAVETNYQMIADSLEIQSTFGTEEVFPNAPIVVYSPDNPTEPWLEGTTDAEGKFVFNPDPSIAGEWSIEIGEDSHWDRLTIPVDDRGIDLDEIGRLDEPPAHHHRYFANPFMIAAVALGTGIGGRLLGRKLKG